MTIDRHPVSLKELIREHLNTAGFQSFEVSYENIGKLNELPLEEIDAVLLAPARYFPPTALARLTRCKLMQVWSSGYDKFNVDDAIKLNIPVANNHGSNAISVAEHAIFMMLGISRRAPEMHQRVITGAWSGNDHGMSSYSLFGKTLGLVGLGNIGSLVAARAEALGMSVLFSDPAVEAPKARSWKKVDFEKLLGLSDYLSFHVHSNKSTRDMIGDQQIALMARKPFLINVSRAELFNKRAILSALDKGLIRGIALDAHYQEPTNTDDSLFSYPNTFFSPHVAGSTLDSYSDTVTACLTNIKHAISGDKVSGLIR